MREELKDLEMPKITAKHFLIVYIMQNGQKTNFNRCKV